MLKPADKTIRASDMRFDFILLRRLTKRLKPIHPPKQDGFFFALATAGGGSQGIFPPRVPLLA